MIKHLYFQLVSQENRQISLDTISMNSDHLIDPSGTILVRLAPFPAAIACRDLVFVLCPSGSKGSFYRIRQPSSGRRSGNSIRAARPKPFLCAHRKLSYIVDSVHTNRGNSRRACALPLPPPLAWWGLELSYGFGFAGIDLQNPSPVEPHVTCETARGGP